MTDMHTERIPWSQSDWVETAHAWILEQLARKEYLVTGAIEQIKSSLWSYVARIATNKGYCYFKAVMRSLKHEVPATVLLREIAPTFVPKVLAEDAARNWLLLEDGGQTLGSYTKVDHDMTRWEEMVRELARLQIQVAPQKEQLLQTGIFDRRLSSLPQLYNEALQNTQMLMIEQGGLRAGELEQLQALAPQIQQMCTTLATYTIPETLHHDDLGGNNILYDDGRYLFFDWSESAVAHPFFTLMIVLRYVKFVCKCDDASIERIQHAYLSCWTPYEPMERLQEAFTLALRLARLVRALSWQHVLGHLAPEERGEYADAFPYWLQVFLGTQE